MEITIRQSDYHIPIVSLFFVVISVAKLSIVNDKYSSAIIHALTWII